MGQFYASQDTAQNTSDRPGKIVLKSAMGLRGILAETSSGVALVAWDRCFRYAVRPMENGDVAYVREMDTLGPGWRREVRATPDGVIKTYFTRGWHND